MTCMELDGGSKTWLYGKLAQKILLRISKLAHYGSPLIILAHFGSLISNMAPENCGVSTVNGSV